MNVMNVMNMVFMVPKPVRFVPVDSRRNMKENVDATKRAKRVEDFVIQTKKEMPDLVPTKDVSKREFSNSIKYNMFERIQYSGSICKPCQK